MMTPIQIAQAAKDQLALLTGLKPDTISRLQPSETGWNVDVVLVERKAVPDTNDVLAIYETLLDKEGNLLSYQRGERYRRGEVR